MEKLCKDYNFYNKIYIFEEYNRPPPLPELFKNIKIHFLNQNINGKFSEYPQFDNFIFIGGIHVEERGILTQDKLEINDGVKFNLSWNSRC
ncbi:unnamed protein product [Meloidogyne enterolobii]|uniref:Uncharacterized protein n=1 Tax=Meloidogyne enterolobii TaxID=390850 RepID=A0ACB0Z0F0_MELEN